LRSPTPLAPVLHQDLRVEVQREDGEPIGCVAVPLTAEQLRSRQTLVTAPLPKLRWLGSYRATWFLGPRCMSSQSFKVISKKAFHKGLRVSATRFAAQRESGAVQTLRSLPTHDGQLALAGVQAVVPCFYVSSGEAGMAGTASF